jgi:hypothetical protein
MYSDLKYHNCKPSPKTNAQSRLPSIKELLRKVLIFTYPTNDRPELESPMDHN